MNRLKNYDHDLNQANCLQECSDVYGEANRDQRPKLKSIRLFVLKTNGIFKTKNKNQETFVTAQIDS